MIADFLSKNVVAVKSVRRETTQFLAEVLEEVHLEKGTMYDISCNEHLFIIFTGQVNLLFPKAQTPGGKSSGAKSVVPR